MHSVPQGSKFNLCGFGSDFEFLYPESVDYNEKTMEEALEDIDTYNDQDRCMGGTEIYSPLQQIFNQKTDHGLRR